MDPASHPIAPAAEPTGPTRDAPARAPRPTPLLVLSLDFELYWGVRDLLSPSAYRRNLEGVRIAVPRMLEMFRRYDVRATWATVGLLMLRDARDARAHRPSRLPGYRDDRLCPFRYLERDGASLDAALHFAPDLVERILDTPGQELATHTFSHFYCLEPPASVEAFRADIEAALAVARSRFGVELRSLVFPRNQSTPRHVRAAGELGIRAYRGNPDTWMYRPRPGREESLARRAARLADAFLPVSPDLSFAIPSRTVADAAVNVPASRFLRPWTPAQRGLEPLRLLRIRREMEAAAERGRGYHLWWHPHNFGAHPEQNLGALGALLEAFARLRRTHGMRSATMADAAGAVVRAGAAPSAGPTGPALAIARER